MVAWLRLRPRGAEPIELTFLSGDAADAQSGTSANRLEDLHDKLKTLESLLRHVKVVTTPDGLKEVVITGANLRIVNGLGSTDCADEQSQPIPDCPNGLGNLIVGYNESRNDPDDADVRTGSHNVVVGMQHNFSRFGGLVVGQFNTISGDFASVSAGDGNEAIGERSSVSGGSFNRASGFRSSVSGGCCHTASDLNASVSGGINNTASGTFAFDQRGGWQHGQRRHFRGQRRGVATRPAAPFPWSAAGRTLPKRRSSAGRRDQKVRRSW